LRQFIVISGKGGTGKTTLLASFASLACSKMIIVDCDVDAPDLHLLLKPRIKETRDFWGLKKAVIDRTDCTCCGACEAHCRFGAIKDSSIDDLSCEGCGVCLLVCPSDAVKMVERLSGHAYISDTAYGPMVHANLLPGEEASGKLVTLVRNIAREIAEAASLNFALIDGSPGIGCPVIASLTGVDLAMVVTEPTLSGIHDLERVLEVTKHFGINSIICINRYDLNEEMSHLIEDLCRHWDMELVGRIPFDEMVVGAMVSSKPVVELNGPAAEAIREIWSRVEDLLALEGS
jgi:MinD superfamily P-loop ATPase